MKGHRLKELLEWFLGNIESDKEYSYHETFCNGEFFIRFKEVRTR